VGRYCMPINTVTLRFGAGAPWGATTGVVGIVAFLFFLFGVDVLWVVLGGTIVSVALL